MNGRGVAGSSELSWEISDCAWLLWVERTNPQLKNNIFCASDEFRTTDHHHTLEVCIWDDRRGGQRRYGVFRWLVLELWGQPWNILAYAPRLLKRISVWDHDSACYYALGNGYQDSNNIGISWACKITVRLRVCLLTVGSVYWSTWESGQVSLLQRVFVFLFYLGAHNCLYWYLLISV